MGSFGVGPRQRLIAACVHAVVVGKIGRVFNIAYPVTAGPIPLDRLREAFAKTDLGRPVPFALNLRTVDRVAAIVARPILDALNQRFRLSEQPKDLPDYFDVGHLIAADDVVDLAGFSLLPPPQHRAGMRSGENPFTNISSVSING